MKEAEEERIKHLTLQQKNLSKNYLISRKNLQHDINLDEKQLRFMSDESNKTLRYFEAFKIKGQQILQIIQTTKKYETEKEALSRWLPVLDEAAYQREYSEKFDLSSLLPSSSSDESTTSEQLQLPGWYEFK